MADTAHVPNVEKPAEFNRLVLDFLNCVIGLKSRKPEAYSSKPTKIRS
ncbi:hypothetical protein [Methanosarcina sp. UBA5]|nr:hypothetical protein [Methanosarcina sp. UBA5]